MNQLVPCPECNRHVRVSDSECPFCALPLDLSATPPPRLPSERLSRAATLAFKNPKRDVWFYLNLDGRPDLQAHQPQEVTVSIGDQVIDKIPLSNSESVIRKVPITAQQLGSADMVELKIDAGESFIPAQTPAAKSTDPRELGVRVFHAFVEPK